MVFWGLQRSRHHWRLLLWTKRHTKKLIFPSPIVCSSISMTSKVQFYRRELPESCISFSSEEGKRIFTESLLAGYANVYFPLAEQFRTQDEPAYCGLSTLVMALNTLEVDPKRVWKGPWRWYHENMLDCCFPLELVQQNGITFDQFVCLATCNYLDLNVVRMNEENISIDEFRKVIKEICSGSGKLLICSYSRKCLGQTGDGHYSPIGAYYPKDDLILIMDVARFKYPPHWVKVQTLWEAMFYLDQVTGLPRGYIIMRKTEEMPLLLFRLSTAFRVTISTHDMSRSHMAIFLKSWRSFLIDDRRCCISECDSLTQATTSVLKALNEALSSLLEGDSIFTTQFNPCCVSGLHTEQVEGSKTLLAALENTEVYGIIDKWVKEFMANNRSTSPKLQPETAPSMNNCGQNNCCGLNRVGRSRVQSDSTVAAAIHKTNGEAAHETCGDEARDDLHVTNSHYITMLLFCWPYDMELASPYTKCLASHVEDALQKCDKVLANEARQLRQQIMSLISMVTSQKNGNSSTGVQ